MGSVSEEKTCIYLQNGARYSSAFLLLLLINKVETVINFKMPNNSYFYCIKSVIAFIQQKNPLDQNELP